MRLRPCALQSQLRPFLACWLFLRDTRFSTEPTRRATWGPALPCLHWPPGRSPSTTLPWAPKACKTRDVRAGAGEGAERRR